MLTRGSKNNYDRHDNDSTVKEAPFIRTRQPHQGEHPRTGTMHWFPTPNTTRLQSPKSMPQSYWYHTVPCPWTCSLFRNYRVIHLRLCLILPLLVSCTIGNMRNAWEWCYYSTVRDVASPSCQLSKNWYLKLTTPFCFICQHPAFSPLMTETRVY